MTTPIRLTEAPEDPNHVQEWFPTRPPLFLRVPVFRLACNAVSIYAGVNAMTWLRLRPRLFMMQIVAAERR